MRRFITASLVFSLIGVILLMVSIITPAYIQSKISIPAPNGMIVNVTSTSGLWNVHVCTNGVCQALSYEAVYSNANITVLGYTSTQLVRYIHIMQVLLISSLLAGVCGWILMFLYSRKLFGRKVLGVVGLACTLASGTVPSLFVWRMAQMSNFMKTNMDTVTSGIPNLPQMTLSLQYSVIIMAVGVGFIFLSCVSCVLDLCLYKQSKDKLDKEASYVQYKPLLPPDADDESDDITIHVSKGKKT